MNESLENEIMKEFKPYKLDELTKESILDKQNINYVLALSNSIDREEELAKLQIRAKELKVYRQFTTMFKQYREMYIKDLKSKTSNEINFTNCPLQNIKCGKWIADDTGVYRLDYGPTLEPIKVKASSIPILPIQRLVNKEEQIEKVKIIFLKDGEWKQIIVSRNTIASKAKILQLADLGVEVNEDNAKYLISYLADIIELNKLEVKESTTHLGWIDDEFAPYTEDLVYDGENNFRDVYVSVCERGNYNTWKTFIRDLRAYSKVLHFIIATSFASPLIKILGINSYIVHLWGGTGVGKTVALMVAMSIWGNPAMGKLTRSLNSTQVALARYASFIHSLPFAGDELQTIKNKWDSFDNLIMYLTEGIDRGRGQQFGGIETLNTWNCNFIFTGEEPITKSNSGGGAKNRCIEIKTEEKLIQDGNIVSNFVRENYGFAGKDFINLIKETPNLQEQYKNIFDEVLKITNTTDKQAMAISSIILADKMSSEHIFNDAPLKLEEIKEWITKVNDVDISTRAYLWTVDWVVQNENKFKGDYSIENWGKFIDTEDGKSYVYINRKVYVSELEKAGFDFDAIKENLATKGWLIKGKQEYAKATRIGSRIAKCVQIMLPNEEEIEEDAPTLLPF